MPCNLHLRAANCKKGLLSAVKRWQRSSDLWSRHLVAVTFRQDFMTSAVLSAGKCRSECQNSRRLASLWFVVMSFTKQQIIVKSIFLHYGNFTNCFPGGQIRQQFNTILKHFIFQSRRGTRLPRILNHIFFAHFRIWILIELSFDRQAAVVYWDD